MVARKIPFALLGGVALIALGWSAAPATAGSAPQFTTGRLAHTSGRSEPRITVAPGGTDYVVTNGTTENDLGLDLETVFASKDGGLGWKQTSGQPTDQTEATTDVDIVATRSGRVITSELDYGGIN